MHGRGWWAGLKLFRDCKERVRQLAGTMSGAGRRCFRSGVGSWQPSRLLIIDEPSLGLSPLVVKENFGVSRGINEAGTLRENAELRAAYLGKD